MSDKVKLMTNEEFNTPAIHIVDSSNGCFLRVANDEEIEKHFAGQTHPMFKKGHTCFEHNVRLNPAESSHSWNGPGINNGS